MCTFNMCTCLGACVCTCSHVCVFACLHRFACFHVCTCLHVCTRLHVCMFVRVCVFACLYICMFTCLHVYLYMTVCITRPWADFPRFMVDISTVGIVAVPKRSALETSRRELPEDSSFGIFRPLAFCLFRSSRRSVSKSFPPIHFVFCVPVLVHLCTTQA